MERDALRGRVLHRGEPRGGRRPRRGRDACSPPAGGRGSRSTACARASCCRPSCCQRARPAPLVVRYAVDGATERLVYLSEAGDLAAYEELRSGFTAAVSHELRTPLARLLSLLELARLPGEDVPSSSSRRAREVDRSVELIDEVLFLAELESGPAVVSLGAEPVLPVLHEVAARARGAGGAGRRDAARRGRRGCERRGAAAHAARRRAGTSPRTRSATPGPGANAMLSVRAIDGEVVLRVVDDGAGVDQADLAAAVRALLPGRPVARLARHRPRARDREARRRLGGRHGRGARRTRAGARDPLLVPHPVVAPSPPFHQIFTSRHPMSGGPLEDSPHEKTHGTTLEHCAPAAVCSPCWRPAAAATTATTRAARRPPPAAAATCPAGSRPTARARSGRTRPPRPSASSSENSRTSR